jgi:hypothetical protein
MVLSRLVTHWHSLKAPLDQTSSQSLSISVENGCIQKSPKGKKRPPIWFSLLSTKRLLSTSGFCSPTHRPTKLAKNHVQTKTRNKKNKKKHQRTNNFYTWQQTRSCSTNPSLGVGNHFKPTVWFRLFDFHKTSTFRNVEPIS